MNKNEFLSCLASECRSFNPSFQGMVCRAAAGMNLDGVLVSDFEASRVRALLLRAKQIPLNDRLSLNPGVFAAIDRIRPNAI
jgi:hypothetical protein